MSDLFSHNKSYGSRPAPKHNGMLAMWSSWAGLVSVRCLPGTWPPLKVLARDLYHELHLSLCSDLQGYRLPVSHSALLAVLVQSATPCERCPVEQRLPRWLGPGGQLVRSLLVPLFVCLRTSPVCRSAVPPLCDGAHPSAGQVARTGLSVSAASALSSAGLLQSVLAGNRSAWRERLRRRQETGLTD